jgi:hypothetical protein
MLRCIPALPVTALLLALPLGAGAPQPKAPGILPGGFRSLDPASDPAKAAAGAVQKELALLTVNKVEQAFVQVVAGMNYRLVCQAQRGEAVSTWEFIIWSKLDGTWELTSARKL